MISESWDQVGFVLIPVSAWDFLSPPPAYACIGTLSLSLFLPKISKSFENTHTYPEKWINLTLKVSVKLSKPKFKVKLNHIRGHKGAQIHALLSNQGSWSTALKKSWTNLVKVPFKGNTHTHTHKILLKSPNC